MRQSITVEITDKIEVWDDWGYPTGIRVGDVELVILGERDIVRLRSALDNLQVAREARYREADEDESATGPELAGFEQEVA
jgi:hypothetical protein